MGGTADINLFVPVRDAEVFLFLVNVFFRFKLRFEVRLFRFEVRL